MTGTTDYRAAFARRMQYALFLRQLKESQRVTQEQIGVEVSKLLGLPAAEALRSASVSRWLLGQSVPDAPTMQAIAAALEVDPGWLAFGQASTAAAPYNATQELVAHAPPEAAARPARQRRTGRELVARARVRAAQTKEEAEKQKKRRRA